DIKTFAHGHWYSSITGKIQGNAKASVSEQTFDTQLVKLYSRPEGETIAVKYATAEDTNPEVRFTVEMEPNRSRCSLVCDEGKFSGTFAGDSALLVPSDLKSLPGSAQPTIHCDGQDFDLALVLGANDALTPRLGWGAAFLTAPAGRGSTPPAGKNAHAFSGTEERRAARQAARHTDGPAGAAGAGPFSRDQGRGESEAAHALLPLVPLSTTRHHRAHKKIRPDAGGKKKENVLGGEDPADRKVVLDLAVATKELLENSLDAGATAVGALFRAFDGGTENLGLFRQNVHAFAHNRPIKFKDYGADCVEVSDNGRGVDPADYASFGERHGLTALSPPPVSLALPALRNHTSKLSVFSDLANLRSFGFRGEALNSLCSLAEVLTVKTCTDGQAPAGTMLEFDARGALVNQTPVAREVRMKGVGNGYVFFFSLAKPLVLETGFICLSVLVFPPRKGPPCVSASFSTHCRSDGRSSSGI
ncbi:MAG: hypothetical protein BJ554DRAFT_6851, partial [Olpidium bornovanus]